MFATGWTSLRYGRSRLTYADACQIATLASTSQARAVRLDLQGAKETTCGALARLVQLRAALLKVGGELCVEGLQGRAKGLYEIHGMDRLLPRAGTCMG